MRLINTDTLQLEEKLDTDLPPYAILSHRWCEEEITFDDVFNQHNFSRKQGFAKFRDFCHLARSLTCRYAWIDTCCINKASSTELETAINSMHRWYSNSHICIVYMYDIYRGGKSLDQSEWFERGWTLQELIAPRDAMFYDRDWTLIGNKGRLSELLSTATGIPKTILDQTTEPRSCSIAERMSWAANRKTQRIEDQAYSLMGLFDVRIGMRYGEGEQAFIRLQESIIEHSADQSIFAWSMDAQNHRGGYSGMLAPSPSSFAKCNTIINLSERQAFSKTNVGLSINLPTFPYGPGTYMAFLDCTRREHPRARCAILLASLHTDLQYARVMDSKGVSLVMADQLDRLQLVSRNVYVRQLLLEFPQIIVQGFRLRTLRPPGHQLCREIIVSRAPTSLSDRVLLRPGQHGTAGIVLMEPVVHPDPPGEISQIRVGFDADFTPHILLVTHEIAQGCYALPYELEQGRWDRSTSDNKSFVTYNYFNNSWMKRRASPDYPLLDGLYHLKIDKDKGYEGVLETLKLGIKVKLRHDPEALPDRNELIWTVDVTDHRKALEKRDMKYEEQRRVKTAERRRERKKSITSCVWCLSLFACCAGLWNVAIE